MALNRIRKHNRLDDAAFAPVDYSEFAHQAAAVQAAPMMLVAIPIGAMPITAMPPQQMVIWQQQVFQTAYARAKAARIPRHYRRFFSNWN